MTIRPEVGRVWASAAASSNVQDPDKYTPNKVNLGWVSEIPPYQWFNWLLKRNDELKRSLVERGIAAWGSDVTYLAGALTYNDADSTIYTCLKGNKGVQPDKDNGVTWVASAVQITKDDFLRLTQILDDHIKNKSNPHGVTAEQISAYTKAQIDALLNKYNGDFTSHTKDFNNPHKVTAAQAGAVPITGGKYSGAVEFTQSKMNIGSTTTGFDSTSNYVRIFKDDKGLGVNASGKPVFSSGSSQKELLYSENFADLTLKNNPAYAVPPPDLHIPLNGDTCIYEGEGVTEFSRASRASYVNRQGTLSLADVDEFRFEQGGLKIEGVNTNLVRNSNPTKDGFSCGQGSGVISSGTPWGVLNMTKFNTSNSWIQFIDSTLTLPQSQGKTLCGSFYIRKNSPDASMEIYLSEATGYVTVYFDETKNKGQAHVEKISSNIYRVWLTHSFASSDTRVANLFCQCGTGDELGGMQIEESSYPTSWILTTSAAATRANEALQVSPNFAGAGAMTISIYYDLQGKGMNTPRMLFWAGSAKCEAFVDTAGAMVLRGSSEDKKYVYISKDRVKQKGLLTFTFSTEGGVGYIDGVEVGRATGNFVGTPPTQTKGFIGSSTGNPLVGLVKNFRVWYQVLTPEQISTL